MIRRIIKIDEELCNGCGLCADACHEAAIVMVEGKARLLRDDYCDGLGNCLPVCPTGAISFEDREAAAFDEKAVQKNLAERAAEPSPAASLSAQPLPIASSQATSSQTTPISGSLSPEAKFQADPESQGHAASSPEPFTQEAPLACGCPGTQAKAIKRPTDTCGQGPVILDAAAQSMPSQLRQWPVQIKLVPVRAPYLEQADILVAADCTAYAYAGFHGEFMKDRITLIGCPKLDEGDYTTKLTELVSENNIKSLTVARMEVPCCGGIENAARTALKHSGRGIPFTVITISTDGQILKQIAD